MQSEMNHTKVRDTVCDLCSYFDKEHTPGEELVFIPVPYK